MRAVPARWMLGADVEPCRSSRTGPGARMESEMSEELVLGVAGIVLGSVFFDMADILLRAL